MLQALNYIKIFTGLITIKAHAIWKVLVHNMTHMCNLYTLIIKHTHSCSYTTSYSHRSSKHPVYGLEKVNHRSYLHQDSETNREREKERD